MTTLPPVIFPHGFFRSSFSLQLSLHPHPKPLTAVNPYVALGSTALRASAAGWRWERLWAKASSHPFHTGWKWKKEKKEEQAEERKWRRTCALCGCDLLDLVLMFFPYHSEGDASFTVCYGCHNTVPPTGYLKQEKFVISKLWKFLGPTTDFPTWGSSKGTENPQGIWLWRAQTKPCAHQEPGERSNVPTRDWARLACDCPRVSSGGVGQQWPAVGSGALNTKVQASILLKEVAITVITATIVWPQAENTATPISRKLD